MNARPSVGIVVVNWNGLQPSRACLRSLFEMDYAPFHVAVIDNGSTDGSAEQLAAEFPGAEVIALGANRGYAGACNAGLRWAHGRGLAYVWLLNNDTTVEPDALTALASAARDIGRPAILAPEIATGSGEGRIWSAGGVLRWPWLEREHIGSGMPLGSFRETCEVPWASGCSLFLSMEAAALAGPMDERYFLYLEDVDWCLTARRRGVPVYVAPEARIWHAVSRSTNTLDPRIARYYACRNYFLLAFRHAGAIGRLWAAGRLAVTLAKTGARMLVSPGRRHDGYYHAQTRAMIDVLRRRHGPAPYPHDPVRRTPVAEEREATVASW